MNIFYKRSRLLLFIGLTVLLTSKLSVFGQNQNNLNKMETIKLMRKAIVVDSCPILFNEPITTSSLASDWTIHHSEWKVEDGWLFGKNPGNFPGMAIMKKNFFGNVLIEFEASTVAPSKHDINVMWNGEWLDSIDQRGIAYVAGLQGWWTGKVGIEKSNDYKFMVGTPLFHFEPGRIYKIQAGSIDGHCFIFADGQLLLEAMDPNPIDNQKYGKIGFEAYSSWIKIRNVVIRQIVYNKLVMSYIPEF